MNFRLNSRISSVWSIDNVIVSVPRVPTEPPYISDKSSYENYNYNNKTLPYALLRFLSTSRSFKEIEEEYSSVAAQELIQSFSELEKKRIIVPAFSQSKENADRCKIARKGLNEKLKTKELPLSPVLLAGGGIGQATVGLAYLASYLDQKGVVTKVWSNRESEGYLALREHVSRLFSTVAYPLVGISFKWFHHVSNALMLGAVINELYPDVIIAYGGNSATLYKNELLEFAFVDCVILGDGERPLYQLCSGDTEEITNCIFIENGLIKEKIQSYSQVGSSSENIRLSPLERIFLSNKDLLEAHGLVVGGKGCDDNCLYCGGGQPNQIKIFHREHSFLRPAEDVENDIKQMLPYHAGFLMDFTSSNADIELYLRTALSDIDLSQRSLMLASWSVPSLTLIEFLSSRFYFVWGLIDVGCLSEKQRHYLWQHGYYKHSLENNRILAFFDDCQRFGNVLYGLYSIFGLPYTTVKDLEAERDFMGQLEKKDSFLSESNLMLQSQPGAFVTENAQMFDMHTEARSFQEYLKYFEETGQIGHLSLRIKYNDPEMDAKIVESTQQIHARISKLSPPEYDISGLSQQQLLGTILVNEKHLRFAMTEAEWYGDHRECSTEDHTAIVLFKNFRDYYMHFNQENMPFLNLNSDAEAYAIADDVISLFKEPLSVADALRIIKQRRNISEEQFLELTRLAVKRYLLKRADK